MTTHYSDNNQQFLCKYCEDTSVPYFGGVCTPCEKIANKVRQEEQRYWSTQIKQVLNQLIRRIE